MKQLSSWYNSCLRYLRINATPGKIASLSVIVTMTLFVYSKVATHRSGYSARYISNADIINKLFLVCLFIAIAIKFIVSFAEMKTINIKRLPIFLFLLVIASLYFSTRSIGIDFFLAGCIGFALWKEKPSFIIKSSFYSFFVFFILYLVGYSLGFLKESGTWARDGNATQRLDFGFGYPTYVFTYFLPVLLGLYYINRHCRKKIAMAACAVFLLIIYFETDTRAVVLMTVLVLANPLGEWFLKRSKICRWITVMFYPILSLVSFAGIYLLLPSMKISGLTSGRLWFWYQYVKGGVKFFGSTDANYDNYFVKKLPLDNQMLLHLFVGGIIVFIVIGLMYMRLTHYALATRDYRLALIIVNTLEFGLLEANFQLGVIIVMPLMFSVFLKDIPDNKSLSNIPFNKNAQNS